MSIWWEEVLETRKERFFEDFYPETLQDLLDDGVEKVEAVEMAMEILEEAWKERALYDYEE